MSTKQIAEEKHVARRGGEPVPENHAVQASKESIPRVPGKWKGKVSISTDFDTLPGELQADFNGRE